MNEDATRVAEMLADVVRALNAGEEYEGTDAEEFLMEWVAEKTIHAHLDVEDWGDPDAEWTVDTVEVLIGHGGPTEWVTFYEADRAEVHYNYGQADETHDLPSALAAQLASVWGIDEVLS